MKRQPDKSQEDLLGVRAAGQQPELKKFVSSKTSLLKGLNSVGHKKEVDLPSFIQDPPPTMTLCQISTSHSLTLSQQIPLLPFHQRY